MSLCRLCHLDRDLRNSHIVPEFLYDDLYNANGHLMAINGLGSRGWKTLQEGVREYLLCEVCEQHFNEYCEKPFRTQWVEAAPLPNPWNVEGIHWACFDYASFKLFHLSVLFRASVSSLPTFAAVSLGPHVFSLMVECQSMPYPGTRSRSYRQQLGTSPCVSLMEAKMGAFLNLVL
jgi:hypothetical protein